MVAYLKNGEIIGLNPDSLDEIPKGTDTIDFDHGLKTPTNMTDEEALKLVNQWQVDTGKVLNNG